jgi:hypothetical protein
MGKTTDDLMLERALDSVGNLAKLNQQERESYLSAMLMISYKLLRTVAGDKFVQGWLESALEEVKTEAPDIKIRELN